jgi:hypothetical protein
MTLKIEKNTKAQQKLYFVRDRDLGDSMEESTFRSEITIKIDDDWQNRRNKEDYEGLLHKSDAGRHYDLNNEEEIVSSSITLLIYS